MEKNLNSVNNIYLVFFAKRVKRDSLFEPRAMLIKDKIKLLKPTIEIEKKIRKVRLLDGLVKSSVLVGIPVNHKLEISDVKKISLNQIPGIEFLGVLINEIYLPKSRLNSFGGDLTKNKILFQTVAQNAITNPIAIISGKTPTILSLVSHFSKKIK
jgi:hypothetical protein